MLLGLAAPAPASAYEWPVQPFDHQHPIRGTFDDPRTRTGRVDRDPTNPQSFHDGVDIQAPDGTPVYAIEPGQVFIVSRTAVAVVSPFWSADPPVVFGYWHIDPAVASHQLVGRHELLGYIHPGAGHVHLSEQRRGAWVNPLRAGGLTPYVDRSAPFISKIVLRSCDPHREVQVDAVTGCVNLVVEAFDRPALPLAAPWTDNVLPPYKITWSGLFPGDWHPPGIRRSLEFDHLWQGPLDDVYAPGTRQNLKNRPGTYFFWLARNLDTEMLADGAYTTSVSVYDIRGNEARSTFTFTVANSTTGKKR